MKRHLLLLFVALLPIVASAYDAEIDGIYYNFSGDEAIVTYFQRNNSNSYSGDVVIPESVTYNSVTYTVTSIGNYTFYMCRGLTSVTIPECVTGIGNSAFQGCSSLTSIIIPSNVTSIANYLFNSCSSLTSITIPNSVISIGKGAFIGCCSLATITVPESVTNIGDQAFLRCSSLTSVTIPNSVTYLGKEAFSGCSSLTSITIPESVTSIGNLVFNGCIGLTSITVENGNTYYDSRNNCNAIIETSTNTLIAGCKNSIIPNSVTSIENGAFSGCSGLTSITIGNGVTSIGSNAFSGCSSLTSVTLKSNAIVSANRSNSNSMKSIFGNQVQEYVIGEGVTAIGDYAFSGCNGLISITIPESVTSIGDNAFDGTAWYDNQPNGLIYAGKVAYRYKGKMPQGTRIIIKEGTLGIATNAFRWDCGGMVSITIPNSVQVIGYYAFFSCSSLTSINLPSSITTIYYGAFGSCTYLKDVYCYAENVPNASSSTFILSNIGAMTLHVPAASLEAYRTTSPWKDFRRIRAIDTEYISFADANVKSICVNHWDTNGDDELSNEEAAAVTDLGTVFKGNTTITSFNELQYFTGLTSIGNSAFSGCRGLTSVNIPESLTSIGSHAFSDCTSLTSISIPNSVTSIGSCAFSGCTSLASISIPNSVTSIGLATFSDCTSLTSVTIGNKVKEIGAEAFYSCSSLASVSIPNSVTVIYKLAFNQCSSLTSVSIGNGVRKIGNYAFRECPLRNFYIKCTTPPEIDHGTFSDHAYNHTTLYVPTGSWNAYAYDYDDDWYKFINIREAAFAEEQVSEQQVYTLLDAKAFTYLVYDPVNDCIGTINATGINENNLNHSWQIIEAGGGHYLYNIGAKKFVTTSTNGSYALSTTPTTIDMKDGEIGIVIGGQTDKQWALVCNNNLNANQAIIDGIDDISKTSQAEHSYYDLEGKQLNAPQKGINIIRYSDGTSKKVLVK